MRRLSIIISFCCALGLSQCLEFQQHNRDLNSFEGGTLFLLLFSIRFSSGLERSTVFPGETLALRPTAGVAPRVFSITGGAGSLTSSGVFHAPGVLGTTSFAFTDALGDRYTSSITTASSAGNGSFTVQTAVVSCTNVETLAAGDFDADGNADLAVFCGTANVIRTYLGNGDGSFNPLFNLAMAGGGADATMAPGDFNNDGILDLAFFDSSTRGIATGNGDGSFSISWTNGVAGTPNNVAVSDLNNDGIDDFVGAEATQAEVFLGSGSGTATQIATPIATAASQFRSSAIADYNNDGINDYSIVDRTGGTQALRTFLGFGDGSFVLSDAQSEDTAGEGLAVCDINGDGNVDLVMSDIGSGRVSTHIGSGTGTFTQVGALVPVASGLEVICADFNGDSFMDAASMHGANGTYFMAGLSDGGLATPVNTASPVGPGRIATIADFNNDGKLDIAQPETSGTDFEILLGN